LSEQPAPVCIGIPVYNGENYLTEAVQSVLDQTYTDLNLIICDNGSTDGTQEICRDFAAKDTRIHYHRYEENIGAARNYDRVWHLSSGEYFKWLAHDDRILPEYIEKTAEVLALHPDVVLCNSIVEYIDKNGDHLGFYRSVIKDAAGKNTADRFAAMILRLHTCVDFFGLIRREAMMDSRLHEAYRGSDRGFLAQMVLRGRLQQLETPLVQMRQHPNQYSKINNVRKQLAWQDPDRSDGLSEIAIMRLYRTYKELVLTENLSENDRSACKHILRLFWLQGWTDARLIAELLSVFFPGTASLFRTIAIKLRLSGSPEDFSS
jgi:hypothetical protein